MLRYLMILLAWFLLTIAVGLPVLMVGWIRPSQKLMRLASRFFARTMLFIAGVRLVVEGNEAYLDGKSRIFVGNHQSAFDTPILIVALHGDIRFFAKRSLFRIPIFGRVLLRYGHVPVDRDQPRRAVGLMKEAITRHKQNSFSLAIFPEGTRSMDAKLLPFRQGAMKMCARTGLPIVPFAIDGSLAIHRRGDKRVRSGSVRVKFGPAISPQEAQRMSAAQLGERVHMWVSHFLSGCAGESPGPAHDRVACAGPSVD